MTIAINQVDREIQGLLKHKKFKEDFGQLSEQFVFSAIQGCLENCSSGCFKFNGVQYACVTPQLQGALSRELVGRLSTYVYCYKALIAPVHNAANSQEEKRLQALALQEERDRVTRLYKSKMSEMQSLADRCFNQFFACAQEDIQGLSAKIAAEIAAKASILAMIRRTLIDDTMAIIERREHEERERLAAIDRQRIEREKADLVDANEQHAIIRQNAALRDALQRIRSYSENGVQSYRLYGEKELLAHKAHVLQLKKQMAEELPVVLQQTIDRQKKEIDDYQNIFRQQERKSREEIDRLQQEVVQLRSAMLQPTQVVQACASAMPLSRFADARFSEVPLVQFSQPVASVNGVARSAVHKPTPGRFQHNPYQ